MNAIVVYRSKTGFVKKYADWIAEDLSCRSESGENIDIKYLSDYETIIFGGGLYAGGINGIKLIKKTIDTYPDKKIIVFSTGASPGRKEEIDEVWKKAFSPEQLQNIHLFYLRGGFDYNKLGMKDKMLMTLLKKKLDAKKDRTEDEQGMLEAYENPVDFTERDLIKPLIELVNSWKR